MGDSRSLVEDGKLDPLFSPSDVVGALCLLAVLSVLFGGTVTTGLLAACASVGAFLVIQSLHYYAREGVSRVRSLPRMDNRATHKTTTLKAGAGAATVATFAATMVENHGLIYVFKNFGLGGIFVQFFTSAIGLIDGFLAAFMEPFGAFRKGLVDLIDASFATKIISRAATQSADSITTGDWAFFGPFTFAVGIVAFLLGFWIFLQFLQRYDLSPARLLFWRQ